MSLILTLLVCTLFNNRNKECVDIACLLFNAAFDKCSSTDVIWNHTAAKLIVTGAMINRTGAFHSNMGHSSPS
jgi:hypothetical protein